MTRRLAAILVADVVGFSAMMEADEAATLALLRSVRTEVLDPAIIERGGRIFKTTGDGLLVEFDSAVDAVRCAIGVQEAIASREAPIALRIGINLGDIVVQDDDIFGDGINVAARLEALAPPGGVAIAGNVEEQITGKIAATFTDLGERRFKNISRAIRVWQWSPSAAATGGALTGVAAGAEPGRNPVIVVLPFAGPAGDTDIEGLSEGLADNLTTALSRRRGIEVVARGAAAGLKALARDLPAVRAETGADYLLSGSLRRSGTRFRVNAELVDTRSGAPVWSSRYEDEWGDVFVLEDKLTESIATAIRSAMNAFDGRRYGDRPEGALSNAERRAKAAQHFYRFTPTHFAAAERLLDEVLAEDANDAMALSMQAFCITYQGFFEIGGLDEKAVPRALAMAARAVELDRDSDFAYQTRGRLALYLRGDCQGALADARQALSLNPQYPLAIQFEGEALTFSGRPEQGIPLIERTIASDQRDPTNFYRYLILAIGHFTIGNHDDALTAIARAVQGAMDLPMFDLAKAAILAASGRRDEAREVIGHLLVRWPDASIMTIQQQPFERIEHQRRYLEALREAGLPDGK